MKISAFPARDGDCLLVEWSHEGRPHRMLIDGGRAGAWAPLKTHFETLPKDERRVELLVISHIDADHIEGVLKMLSDEERPLTFSEAWFNAYRHLVEQSEEFGPGQGEKLSEALGALGVPWNGRFGARAVVTPENGGPFRCSFAGLELTLLSPPRAKLLKLAREWEKWLRSEGVETADVPPPAEPTTEDDEVEEFGHRPLPDFLDVVALAAAPEKADTEEPNGSSIAFIADDGHSRCLFAADAHPDVLESALEALPEHERRFDLFKLSHHGSAKNLSTRILELIDCQNFLISTNGAIHQHPDPEAIAKIVTHSNKTKTLYFNYAQDWTSIWDDVHLKRTHKYKTVFPAQGDDGFLDIAL